MENDRETAALTALMFATDKTLKEITGCAATRFALIVWCDCNEDVSASWSSDPDSERVAAMLRNSADTLEETEPQFIVAGHA
jgi:hypothetical protein